MSLFSKPSDVKQIDFANEGGETFICGNPPYKGSQSQDEDQKSDLKCVFGQSKVNWKGFDYVCGWFKKAADFAKVERAVFAFVSTNSICQGKSVSGLWPDLLGSELQIYFAHDMTGSIFDSV